MNNIIHSNETSGKLFDTKTIVYCSLFTALIAIGAFIRIPLPVTVFTFQFIFVLLSGALLGAKRGALSCSIYVLLGLIGFPVFAEGGGLGYLLKPTFGYLIAFIITSFIVGYLKEKFTIKSIHGLFLVCFLGMIITYLIGTIYTYLILNYALGTEISYLKCLVSLFPFAFCKDIFSCFVVSIVSSKIGRIL